MNINIDDLLYGILLHNASYDEDSNRLYITKAEYNKKRKFIYLICDLDSRKLKRRLDMLKQRKLIEESKINNNDVMLLKNRYDGRFQTVDYNMLEYLFLTRNKFVIKIYIYLLNKFLWKKGTGELYSFTIKEIQEAIGFSKTTKFMNGNPIAVVLESLKREGVLQYECYYESKNTKDKTTVAPRHRLIFVAETVEQLRES